jgi:hypothetical protein
VAKLVGVIMGAGKRRPATPPRPARL